MYGSGVSEVEGFEVEGTFQGLFTGYQLIVYRGRHLLGYCYEETRLFTIYPYYGDLH